MRRHSSTTNTTLRCLSYLLLFLSVAPMASIYFVFFSLGTDQIVSMTNDLKNYELQMLNSMTAGSVGTDAAATVALTMLSNMLKDPNATIDEIWSSVFQKEFVETLPFMYSPFTSLPYYGGSSFSLSSASLPHVPDLNSFTAHHWAIVIPWMISIFFGLVFPAILSVLSFLENQHHRRRMRQFRAQRRQQQQQQIDNDSDNQNNNNYNEGNNNREDEVLDDFDYYDNLYSNRHSPSSPSSFFDYCSFLFPISKERQRLIKLCVSTRFYSKTLTEEDLVKEKDKISLDHDNDEPSSCWRIPCPGVPLFQAKNTTSTTNTASVTTPVTISTATSTTNTVDTTIAAAATNISSSIDKTTNNNNNNNHKTRHVVGTSCAICLNAYKLGDNVVWSSNPECVHCFHKKCIFSWLLKLRKRKKNQCPCCRQSFILKPTKSTCNR